MKTYGQDYSQHPDFWKDDDENVQPSPIVKRDTYVAAPKVPQAYPIEPPQTVIVERVFDALPGADEKTSGMDRANALVVRMLWPGCAILCISVAVLVLVSINSNGVIGGAVALAVLGLGLFRVYKEMDRQEYKYSRSGLERYRIKKGTWLEDRKDQRQSELRKAALAEYFRALEGSDDD